MGPGDDAAVLAPVRNERLVVTTDAVVEGVHFSRSSFAPADMGHKALAVNLSDLAAMGAQPLGFTLALALPHADSGWLDPFARGLFALADAHACPLVGGDTTRGPLNLCITVFGEVKPGNALRRDAALAGDDVYVSGRTGEARLALEHLRGTGWALAACGPDGLSPPLRARLERPTPRNALGMALAEVAGVRAAIDLSDGLAGDLGHILRASGVGADVNLHTLPVAPALQALSEVHRLECLIAGGDDYELLFTAAPEAREAIAHASAASGTPVTRIGRTTATPGLRWLDSTGQQVSLAARGFDHFA